MLSQINKVFEKLIHKRMMTFTNENNILTNCQFGFRKGHSTSHGITHVNEQITKHLEQKRVCAALFIDLKSAFDTVDLNILAKTWSIMDFVVKFLISLCHICTTGNSMSNVEILNLVYWMWFVVFPRAVCLGPYYLSCILMILKILTISNASSLPMTLLYCYLQII